VAAMKMATSLEQPTNQTNNFKAGYQHIMQHIELKTQVTNGQKTFF